MKWIRDFFNNRNIIILLIILCAIPALWVWFSRPTFMPRHVMLSWTGEPATTMTITWQTGRYSGGTQVEYKETTGNAIPAVVSGTANEITTDKGFITVHCVKLTGLKPGTAYRYHVGGNLFWSSYFTFTTASASIPSFEFLLFGDSQSSSYDLWRRTLHTAYEKNPGAAFMVNIGDLVDIGLNYTQWKDWFEAGRGVIDALPVMPVMGNHETYTTEWKIAPPVLYTAFFNLPDNGPAELRGKVYSFDYGEAHFSILDSQRQEEGEAIPQILALQQEWLAKDLAATHKPWKFVLMHRPVYHNRPAGGDEDLRDAFTSLFEKYHVDVVLNGHDHSYARSYPISQGKWTNEKGAGPVYITAGRSGAKTYDRAQAKEWDAVFYNPVDQPNYLIVDVSSDKIAVKVFKLDGVVIDQWEKRHL